MYLFLKSWRRPLIITFVPAGAHIQQSIVEEFVNIPEPQIQALMVEVVNRGGDYVHSCAPDCTEIVDTIRLLLQKLLREHLCRC